MNGVSSLITVSAEALRLDQSCLTSITVRTTIQKHAAPTRAVGIGSNRSETPIFVSAPIGHRESHSVVKKRIEGVKNPIVEATQGIIILQCFASPFSSKGCRMSLSLSTGTTIYSFDSVKKNLLSSRDKAACNSSLFNTEPHPSMKASIAKWATYPHVLQTKGMVTTTPTSVPSQLYDGVSLSPGHVHPISLHIGHTGRGVSLIGSNFLCRASLNASKVSL